MGTQLNSAIGQRVMDTEEKENPVQRQGKRKTSQPAPKSSSKKTTSNRPQSPPKNKQSRTVQEPPADLPEKTQKLFLVKFFYEWCKSCGICGAMCPKKIILFDDHSHPLIEDIDDCIGCRNCEIHCPDFAITVKRRHPERRKSNGTR